MSTSPLPMGLPPDWPTIADVYYEHDGTLGTEMDFAVDEHGTTFFVASSQVARLPIGAPQETVDAVKEAIRGTVDRIGLFAIRPFPPPPPAVPSADDRRASLNDEDRASFDAIQDHIRQTNANRLEAD